MQTTVFNLDQIAHTIIFNFDRESKALFHKFARDKLNEQISKGNNKFATYIDRRPGTVTDIEQARKQVRFQFTANAIKLAIRIMEEELRKSVSETTTSRTGKLRSNIKVFYAKRGASLVEVSHINELDNFQQGDQVFLCPAQPYSGIVLHHVTQASSRKKTKKYGKTKPRRGIGGGLDRKGQGFIALAARRIRTIVGQQPQGAGLSVLGFTSAALIPLVWGNVTNQKLIGKGVPAISIAYKFNQTAGVVNG